MLQNKLKTQRTNLKIYQQSNIYNWAEAFLIDRKAQNLSTGTLKFYRDKLRLFINYCNGQLIFDITEITPNNLRLFLLYLQENGHNPGGIHAVFRTIKAFLRWYESENEGYKNPIHKIRSPKVPEKILDPVDLHTVFSMVDTCKASKFIDFRDKAILLCLLDTGTRAQEFLDLNIEDVNLYTGEILIRQGKGRKSRIVFIGKSCRKAIRRYLKIRNDENSSLWITNNTDKITYDGLRAIVSRRAKQIGIIPPSLHSFRRAFAINSLRNGIDIFSLQRLLGHADLSVLKQYLQITSQDLKNSHNVASPVDHFSG